MSAEDGPSGFPDDRMEAVVIGAGPAGLATSRELGRRAVRHVVLEKGEAVGWSWRNTYDSLTLHTGKHMSALPGLGFHKGAPLFLPRDHFVAYLERYAARFQLPVVTGCGVRMDSIPLIGFHLVDAIRAGRVTVRGAPAELTETGARFHDDGGGSWPRTPRGCSSWATTTTPRAGSSTSGRTRPGRRSSWPTRWRRRPPVPFHLAQPERFELYATALLVLLALFVLRVLGQVVVALADPRWLPRMREWYSGLLPYRVLLPIQIVFIAVMVKMTLDVHRGGVGWAAPRPGLGAALVWLSFVYAGGMVVRFVVWLRLPPERRRAWIPIIFHMVLAAFLWVFGSWHVAAG